MSSESEASYTEGIEPPTDRAECGEHRADQVIEQCARAYEIARKRDKSLLLDEVTRLTGLSRGHARRQLKLAADLEGTTGSAALPTRPNFSDEAIDLIRTAWWASGGLSGRYLAACLPEIVDAMERHGHLVTGENGYRGEVRDEVLQASPATVDRFSVPRRRELGASRSWRRAHRMHRFLVRSRARTSFERDEPGYLQLRIRKSLPGPDDATVILVDSCTRWMAVASVRSHHYADLEIAYAEALKQIPFEVLEVQDTDAELPLFELAQWEARHQVKIVQPDGPVSIRPIRGLSRRREPSLPGMGSINQVWRLLTDRLNFWVPQLRPTDERHDGQPDVQRPLSSLLEACVLSTTQVRALHRYQRRLDPLRTASELERLVAGSSG